MRSTVETLFGTERRSSRLADAMIEHRVHRNHRRILPKSLWLFVFAAVVYALQNVPFLDAALMIMMAMFWPIITVNLGFVGIVIEAMAGKVNKGWIVLPLLYFGGNIFLAAASHMEFSRLEREILAYNSGKSVSLAPDDKLLLELTADTNPVPHWLVSRYDIAAVYSRFGNKEDRPITATRIGAAELCKRLNSAKNEEIRVSPIYEAQTFKIGAKQRNDVVQAMCVYDQPDTLRQAPEVKVHFGEKVEQGGFLLPTVTQNIIVTSNTGETIQLVSAKALPLNWIPLPIFGCMRGPGDPVRHCWGDSLRFIYRTTQGADGEPTSLVAKTLGLQYAPASARRDQILARQQRAEAQISDNQGPLTEPRTLVLPELRGRLGQ